MRKSLGLRINKWNFRKLRQECGYTQQRLAEISGYTDRLIRKAESGGYLNTETIEDLCDALSVEGKVVHPTDITTDNSSAAVGFVSQLLGIGENTSDDFLDGISSSTSLTCSGDSEKCPLTGVWRGKTKIAKWANIFQTYFRPQLFFSPIVAAVNGDDILVRTAVRHKNSVTRMSESAINIHCQLDMQGNFVAIDVDIDSYFFSLPTSQD